jgi:hypothetical protein
MINQPQIKENNEQMNACSNSNKGCCWWKSCFSSESFRASFGRIFFWVLILFLVFLIGLKIGVDSNMNMKRGKWMGNGCMMGKYMDKQFRMQQPTAPVADQGIVPPPSEESIIVPAEEITPPVWGDEETLPE